ncbi:MAG: flagellar hook assembly protein FlgD [Burkholderiales bacterium]
MAVTDTTTSAQQNIATAQAVTARRGDAPAKLDTPQQIQDRFLTLLIARMQNQDPLSPMDNAQITQQMAQISTVQGISALNDTMGQLLATQGSQAAQLIGRSVTLAGSNLRLADGVGGGSMLLDGAANQVTVEVLGASGLPVRSINLGAQPAGLLSFQWDGKNDAGQPVPDGNYSYKVSAKAGTFDIGVETFTAARVMSVSLAATGPTLLLDNGNEVPVSSVQRIF